MTTTSQERALSDAVAVLSKHDAARYVDWIEAQRIAPDEPASLVVVGEVKRGKSSLVNVLAGAPVSPVDAGLATAGFIRVCPPTTDLPLGAARLALANGDTRSIDAAAVADWMTIDGAATSGLPWQDRPVGAEVAVQSPLLPDVVLVDTPGVGGLVSAHSRAAVLAAEAASALLFVSDAGQVLTAPELSFLSTVAERVHWVYFAVTKIDRFPSWRTVLEENRALLTTHAPRFAQCPMIPVSAALAQLADGQADPARAAKVREAAGIERLAGKLQAIRTHPQLLRQANALRTARAGCDAVARPLVRARAAVNAGRPAMAALGEERARLDALREQEGRWTLDLQRDLGRLRSSAVKAAQTNLEALRDRWRSRIATERKGMSDAVAQRLAGELESDLGVVARQVAEQFYTGLGQVVADLFRGVDTPPELAGQIGDDLRDLRLSARVRDDAGTGQGIFDPSLIGSASMGLGLAGHLGGGAAALGVVGAPVLLPVALAGGLLALNIRHRRTRAGRAQLMEMLGEAVRTAQGELVGAIDAVLLEIRPEITVAFRNHLRAALTEVNSTIKAAETASQQSEQERARKLSDLTGALGELSRAAKLIDRALAELPEPTGAATPEPTGTA